MTPPPEPLRLFPVIERALFTKRLNRFAVECRLRGRKCIAYLPNPGRLRELLLPGRTLCLAPAVNTGQGRLRFAAVAVEREGAAVLLHTHHANTVVRRLLDDKRIPGYEDATVVQQEIPVEGSRFDFLLEKKGKPFLLEVKSCTLFEDSIAMFPDAVTARGTRHLMELSGLARDGVPGGVIFLIHSPKARWFLPDYHTDPAFTRALLAARKSISIRPLAVSWTPDLMLDGDIRVLDIPWRTIEKESKDRGSYILILYLSRSRNIRVGALGDVRFRKGWYLYAGSAMKDLSKRIDRHLRTRKNPFWHIDYLREHADGAAALAIRSQERLECSLAAALETIAGWRIPGFGSSDCRCGTHLFGMEGNPQEDERFVAVLQHFRMGRLRSLIREP